MMLTSELTAQEWFTAAANWYVPSHQGCCACRARHCVYHSNSSQRVEYYCSTCEFFVCHDLVTETYVAITGGHSSSSVGGSGEPSTVF
jgi:hypothetical protein